MSNSQGSTEGVHRLIDIVAEEVSLVDRAANQRRFLIVKRSEPMENLETEELEPVEGEPAEKASSGDHRLVDTALTALERLTETVETLSVLADGDARESIGEIATELRSLADDLVDTAGGGAPAAEPVTAAAPTSVGAGTPDEVATLLASVRTALADIGTLLGESKRARPKPPAADDTGGAPQKKRDPEPGEGSGGAPAAATPSAAAPAATSAPGIDPMRKEISALTDAVAKLTEATKGHTQRLGHLEKRFGLPNSLPAREQPTTEPENEEVGWPLDLNRPFHREAVDKSVSFHDL